MKAKKLLPVLALALTATTLAACGDKTVLFSPYWHTNALSPSESFYEQAEYKVTSKKTTSNYCNYTVEYTGDFTTILEYNAATDVYVFATELEVTATFALGDTKQEVKDTMESRVEFQAKQNFLRPIKSSKKMTCHTPLSGTYTSAEKCYATVDYEYTIEYSQDANKGTIKSTKFDLTTNDGETTQMTLNDTFKFVKDYSYIDNDQLLVAVRALDETATLGSYNPFAENTQKIKISLSDGDAEEAFTYTLIDANNNENTKERSFVCRTAKVYLAQNNPGVTQIIKFAKPNSTSNTYHSVIMSMTTPLSYGMGEMYYNLTKVSYYKA